MGAKSKSIKSASEYSKPVIGQFEGMCADAEITNENGLDITREVWENVFNSDLYKQAIELGWYIGYLGHPDDPNAMTFQDACIVMKEGHIEDDGKVYGKFDLIDTPVGRIVKSFIDAGVTFGISVRGAGDIIANSVDPDTFVFRGFDLVTFPAYKEAIPTFSEIAASTDASKQQKYKAVCAAVRTNLKSLNSSEAIDIVQEQFAPQSEEYALLEDRRAELNEADNPVDITSEQLEGVMQLYLDEKATNEELADELAATVDELLEVKASYSRKFQALKRITSAQMTDMETELASTVSSYRTVKAASDKLKKENLSLQNDNDELSNKNRILAAKNKEFSEKVRILSATNQDLSEKNHIFVSENSKLQNANKVMTKQNLKYKQKIEAATSDAEQKDEIISSLRSELHETVTAATDAESRTSNRDATIADLRDQLSAVTTLVEDYQNAYAALYASAIGVHVDSVSVTSTTSVKELQTIISSSIAPAQTEVKPTYYGESTGSDGLVTI